MLCLHDQPNFVSTYPCLSYFLSIRKTFFAACLMYLWQIDVKVIIVFVQSALLRSIKSVLFGRIHEIKGLNYGLGTRLWHWLAKTFLIWCLKTLSLLLLSLALFGEILYASLSTSYREMGMALLPGLNRSCTHIASSTN